MTAYTVAQSRPGGPVHLSADGRFTLCSWFISGRWERGDRTTLAAARLAGVRLCTQCEREAERERAAAAATK